MDVYVLSDDEQGYLKWLPSHPDGYVVNTRRELDPSYLILHRAQGRSIRRHRNIDANPGGLTERAYSKICANSLGQLKEHLRKKTGKSEPFSKRCARCNGSP